MMDQLTMFEQVALVLDPDAMHAALMNNAGGYVVIDTETETEWKGVGPKKNFGLTYPAAVIVISFAWKDASGTVQSAALYSKSGEWPEEVRFWLHEVYTHKLTIFHNAVFDVRQLSKVAGMGSDGLPVTPANVWDTQSVERLIAPAVGKEYNLIAVADGYHLEVPSHQLEMKGSRGSLHTMEISKVIEYAKADATLTLAVYEAQVKRVDSEAMSNLVTWENSAVREYGRMAAAGVRLNQTLVRARIADLSAKVEEAERNLAQDGLAKPGSPVERVKYIYEKKGVPRPDKEKKEDQDLFTEKGGLSTAASVVEMLIERYPEHAQKLDYLVTWMRADRALSTLEMFLEHAVADGRIHSMIGIDTATGRRASSQPNIQNLKMQEAADQELIIAMCGALAGDDEHCTLVEIDLSNGENWSAAMLAGDSALAEACGSSDFHSVMAEIYFGEKWKNASKDERKHLRRVGKTITFGSAYGMGPTKMASRVGTSVDAVSQMLQERDRRFPDVAETKKQAEQKVHLKGHISLWTGRVIPVDKRAAYKSWNYLNQGAIGEIVKRAIVIIADEYAEKRMRSRIAIDMHDALIISVAHDEWDEAIQIASRVMESIVPDEMNHNTNPPIRWIARPDFAENAKKWGAGQYHPEPAPVVEAPAQPVVAHLELPELDWSIAVPAIQQGDSLKASDPKQFQDAVLAMLDRIETELARTFTQYPPAIRDGVVTLGEAAEFDYQSWVNMPGIWYQMTCNHEELIGYTKAELLEEYQRRSALCKTLSDRACRIINWLCKERTS